MTRQRKHIDRQKLTKVIALTISILMLLGIIIPAIIMLVAQM